MLTRRAALFAAVATAACTTQSPRSAAEGLLDRAIARIGGADAINRSRVLAWTGRATIHAGANTIEIGAETVVEPFRYARSDTWLLSQGRNAMRSLEINGDTGTMIRNGQSTPMPAATLRNEKAQYASYGLMRLLSLRDAGAGYAIAAAPAGAPATWRYALSVTHPSAVSTTLYFDASAALVGLEDTVPNAEDGGAPIEQRFTFGELRESNTGMFWPASLHIAQNGSPFFDLVFDSFTPRQSR